MHAEQTEWGCPSSRTSLACLLHSSSCLPRAKQLCREGEGMLGIKSEEPRDRLKDRSKKH
eukprot:3729914-Amphidinium_carterae.1